MVNTQYNKTIKVLRTDNGGEFINSKTKQFYKSKGILHQTRYGYHSIEWNK